LRFWNSGAETCTGLGVAVGSVVGVAGIGVSVGVMASWLLEDVSVDVTGTATIPPVVVAEISFEKPPGLHTLTALIAK